MNLIGANFVFLLHICHLILITGKFKYCVYLIKSKFMSYKLGKVVSFDSQIINDDINTTCICTWINTI